MAKNRFPPLDVMQYNGAILHDALLLAGEMVQPGITTKRIDEELHAFIIRSGGEPAFLGYDGFPACCCISVNDQVVHGLPSARVLKDGDIVSVDCGVLREGAYTDSARTFSVGTITKENEKLICVTKEALRRGISKAVAGNRVGEISFAVQSYVEREGMNVSRYFVGHTIGYDLHMNPLIPNYGRRTTGAFLRSGSYVAIEPTVFNGGWKTKDENKWNIVSIDGCMSAHFEDTVYITEGEPILIT